MLPHLKHTVSDWLYVPQFAVLRLFQAASEAAMRQSILETEQPSFEFIGVFDREHNSTVTKRLHIVNLRIVALANPAICFKMNFASDRQTILQ